jgi:hypothetical protein
LYLVWQNLLKPAAQRNLNEDLTGDGQVTMADVDVVKGNYLAALPPPAPVAAAADVPGPAAVENSGEIQPGGGSLSALDAGGKNGPPDAPLPLPAARSPGEKPASGPGAGRTDRPNFFATPWLRPARPEGQAPPAGSGTPVFGGPSVGFLHSEFRRFAGDGNPGRFHAAGVANHRSATWDGPGSTAGFETDAEESEWLRAMKRLLYLGQTFQGIGPKVRWHL